MLALPRSWGQSCDLHTHSFPPLSLVHSTPCEVDQTPPGSSLQQEARTRSQRPGCGLGVVLAPLPVGLARPCCLRFLLLVRTPVAHRLGQSTHTHTRLALSHVQPLKHARGTPPLLDTGLRKTEGPGLLSEDEPELPPCHFMVTPGRGAGGSFPRPAPGSPGIWGKRKGGKLELRT